MLQQDIPYLRLCKEIESGNAVRVRMLLADGLDVDGSVRLRPLVIACFYRNLSMVKLLLDKGADVNGQMRNPEERTQTCHYYLPWKGETALHIAAYHAGIEIAELLMRAGANPNAQDFEGCTPFMACARSQVGSRTLQLARALLKAGADPSIVSNAGWSCLLHACTDGEPSMISMILSEFPNLLHRNSNLGESALHLASVNDRPDVLSQLLAAGARHPRTLEHDYCPLAVAVILGHEEVVRILIARGLPAIGGAAYALPISLSGAVTRGRPRIINLLLGAQGPGTERQLMAMAGGLAGPLLHYAAGYIIPNSVRVLLTAGADERALDGAGQRAVDIIGTMDEENPPISPLSPRIPGRKRNPTAEAEIRRMLLRGPAFRAKSFAWPAGATSGAGSSIFGANGIDTMGSSSENPERKPLGVRVYRSSGVNLLFVQSIDR